MASPGTLRLQELLYLPNSRYPNSGILCNNVEIIGVLIEAWYTKYGLSNHLGDRKFTTSEMDQLTAAHGLAEQ